MIINKILTAIFINTLVIYIISKYLPTLGFHINFLSCSLEVYLAVGFIFWILNEIVKKIVKILTLPINILTLWLFSILINIWFIYLFAYVMNNYFQNLAIVQLWTFVQVAIVSVIIWILNLFLKKL